MSENSITIVGNLTRDPELRFTAGGTAQCLFGVAWNRRYQQGGEWKSDVSFFSVVAWGQLGENVAASLTKGDRVVIFGDLRTRSYEDREGKRVIVTEISADSVAADLKFATVQIERTEREQRRSGPKSAQRDTDPVYGDEEPFVCLYSGHRSYRNLHTEPGF